MEPSKFRPISSINVGGKVLEKLNRIMHRVYTKNLLNHNKFGFTPKKAQHAAMTVKDFVEEGL
jgi:hypothetical protein